MRTMSIVVFTVVCLVGVAPVAAQTAVGAYYYPWWGDGMNPASGHRWDQTLRAHMLPEDHEPLAGYTASYDADTIASHIEQSLQANIGMWSLSWWGPGRFEDNVIRNHILPHADAHKLQYTIHYETTGRFGPFDNPDFGNLQDDFRYLADHVFSDPNYMQIDGRPVVFMYLTRVYLREEQGRQAITDLRQMMLEEYGYEPYIVGDDIFRPQGLDPQRASHLDAVTTFDVYGASRVSQTGVADQQNLDGLAELYQGMQDMAESLGIGYLPGVSPGYNDLAVRDGNPASSRYLQEAMEQLGIDEAMGSWLIAQLHQAALPHTDPNTFNMIMVNSFNEWHEDTQIEATRGTAATSSEAFRNGTDLTQGHYYQDYGTLYLDLLRQYTSGDVTWIAPAGAGPHDATRASHWSAGFAPRYGDRAVVGIEGTDTTLILPAGKTVTWGSLLLSGQASIVSEGDATLRLFAGEDEWAIESAGGPHHSTVTAHITTTGDIRATQGHDLTFNGTVHAGRFEATGATMTFHHSASSVQSATIHVDAEGRINFAGGFIWSYTPENPDQPLFPEFTLEGGGAVYFASYAGPNDLINLRGHGATLGVLADDALPSTTQIWARDDGVTLDLNGHNLQLYFLRTAEGQQMTIDFGNTDRGGKFLWRWPHEMLGTYSIVNFDPERDTLQLGESDASHNFLVDDPRFAQITINGLRYNDPNESGFYWLRDEERYVQIVPEPGSLLLLSGLLALSCRKPRTSTRPRL